MAQRRALPSTTATLAGFHNLSLATTPVPTWCARYSKASPTTAAGCCTTSTRPIRRRRRPDPHHRRGAQSDLWCQIMADVCNRTTERVADPFNAQQLGSRTVRRSGQGELDRTELSDLIPIGGTFAPTAAHRAVYDRLFAEFLLLQRRQGHVRPPQRLTSVDDRTRFSLAGNSAGPPRPFEPAGIASRHAIHRARRGPRTHPRTTGLLPTP